MSNENKNDTFGDLKSAYSAFTDNKIVKSLTKVVNTMNQLNEAVQATRIETGYLLNQLIGIRNITTSLIVSGIR